MYCFIGKKGLKKKKTIEKDLMNTDGFSKKVKEFEIQSQHVHRSLPRPLKRVLAILFSFFVPKKVLKIVFYSGPAKSGSVSVIKLWIYVK